MTSETEDRDNAASARGTKDKRPHAILDLTATEVKTPDPEANAVARTSEVAAGEEKNDPGLSSAALEDAPDPAVRAAEASLNGEGIPARETSARPWFSPGVVSHFAAGLAGGALTLALAAALLSNPVWWSGLSGLPSDIGPIERRLQAIEETRPMPAGIAEERLAKIEDLQARLAGETRELSERLAKPDFAALDGRVAKLEERVAAFSAPNPVGASPGSARQLSAITSKLAEIEARVAKSTDTAEEAALKPEVARLDQAIAALKGDAAQANDAARVARETADALRGAMDGLAAGVEKQFQATAKAGDIAAATAPLSNRLAALEENLGGVLKTEEARRDTAGRILLSLELASLKRAIERGGSYAQELAAVREASVGRWNVAAFDRWKDEGVPAIGDLAREFRTVSHAVLDAGLASETDSVLDRVVASARSIVRVRKIEPEAEDMSVEAVVSRIEKALDAGQLGAVIDAATKLPPRGVVAARGWLAKVEARHTVDAALAAIEGQLKASLVPSSAASSPLAQ